ncbi:Membrane dipeptidase [Alkaliphilus metalliredigens QYMF]|uniref:Membrane dipeptidase n=1 Tax=Alkaliphilus metalliredigens (strain QYMF) TaxID=293826 RepID=A6TSP9_ALKMQ|nr:dipeptidase [Alkaliphilus metalliredigens]ABR49217.1 Membrane dipeptidase [Alkaliphilus metalliredigens QYMF]
MKIFDGHSDILLNVVDRSIAGEQEVLRTHHIDKLKKGGVFASVFALWVEPEAGDRFQLRALEMLKYSAKELHDAKDLVHIVKKYDDFEVAERENKLAVLLGMEGLASLGEEIDFLYLLYQYGIRYAGLTWNEENALATGIDGDDQRGITEKGIEVIKKMEDLGILLDVSHLNEKSFWDVVKVAQKPFIASHSNAYELCGHPRNLQDEQLKAIAQSGGVVGLNSWNKGVDPENPSIEKLADHVEYIVNIVGIEHIAFGFDFCEFLEDETLQEDEPKKETKGFEDTTCVPKLIKVLKERGYTEAMLRKIAYENLMRVFKETI